ncbi:hypothetical protein [Paenibacillus sp. IITD108]|uniref:hypothetical protein n=1 Tax=Paenibacillus sp. IITD108 TaxID=3116649 RepID=UPI002F42FD45
MKLSEAIEKREQVLARAQSMEKWFLEQRFNKDSMMPKDHKLTTAIQNVVDSIYEDWNVLNDKINNVIGEMVIE